MKRFILAVIIFTINSLFSNIFSQTNWKNEYNKRKVFIENKGQFNHFETNETGKIEYAVDFGNTKIFFTKNGVSILLNELERIPKKERIELKKEISSLTSVEDYKEKEKELRRYNQKTDLVILNWNNNSKKTYIETEQETADYHSYTFFDQSTNKLKNINHIHGYEKLIYKNIYPKIDLEYSIHPVIGIKYAYRLHPGANVNDINFTYNKPSNLLNGKIEIPTIFGNIIDHAPITFYEADDKNIIESAFQQIGSNFSFKLGSYDNSKTIVIDPWVQTPAFTTNWDCIWELDTDASGNVYVIGGIMPMQLLKYNSSGVLQWTHNTPYDTTEWLGTMATDDIGNTYITNGTDYKIQKVNTTGTLVWNNNAPSNAGGISTEFWNITFNCDQTKLIVGGSGGNLDIHGRIYDMNLNNGNVNSSLQVTAPGDMLAIPPQIQEVRAMCNAPNGKYYFVTLDTIGYMNDDLTLCGNTTSSIVRDDHGVGWGYKSENFRYSNTGIKVIRADENFLYIHRGNVLQKRSLQDFSIIGTVNIPGGNLQAPLLSGNQTHNAGIDIDDCGNIYVGSTNGVYKFSPALTQLANYPTSFVVYDVRVNTNGEVVACGGTGNSGSNSRSGGVQSFAAAACPPIAITCCDASICPTSTLCVTDAPVSLTVATPGGTWSGTGVNALGVFNPTTAGEGTHQITYTLACGSETITINVSSCEDLEVCQETNGTLTVSNGVGPYTWEHTVTTTTTVTNQAQCTACGGIWVGLFCSVQSCNSTGYQTFGTGTNVTPTSNFPIRVTDSQGTEFIINSLTGIPACSTTPTCPTITVTTSSQSNVTCNGLTNGSATVSATGGTAPYSYTWQPGNLSGASQSNLAANTYTISVTDVNNCPGTGTVTITQPAALAGTTSSNNATCGSSNGSASINVTGGIAPYTYAWSPTGGNAATANNLAAGNYSVTVTDGNNCQITQSVTVNSAGGATITIGTAQNPTCANSTNGSIQTTITGGATPYSIQWTPSGGTSANASNLGAGTYTITVTDNNNCVSSATATLTAPPAITGTISTNPATCGATDGSATVTATGGTGNLSYSWSPTGGNAATANGLSSGPYTVTVSDQNQCSVTFNANVPANGGPTVTINTVSPVLCANGTNGQLTANVSGGTAPFTYSWSPSGGSAASASNLSPGTYTVTVTDAASCVVSATTTLTNPSGINIQENIVPENCGALDGSISVLATGGSGNYTYAWTPNVGSSSSITNLENGDYSVIVTDGNGCSATETYTVGQVGGIIITASAIPAIIDEGQSSQLEAQGGVSYTWSPSNTLSCSDCPNPIATPTETTSYTVVGTDANGCSGEATITIVVNPLCGNVYIPTIFSPNLDGSNDFECVMGNCIVELEFQIFNRWGEVVFQTTDPSVCWDGDYKGKPVNSGTFAYKAYVRRLDGTTESYSGNITLVR